MKITIEQKGKKKIVLNRITDYCVTARYEQMLDKGEDRPKEIGFEVVTRSYSGFGQAPRELVKEVRQSVVELQAYLDNLPQKDGNTG